MSSFTTYFNKVEVIDGEKRDVKALDGIAIPPGARHKITNIGDNDLVFLCCCTPAYEHDDTVIINDDTTFLAIKHIFVYL